MLERLSYDVTFPTTGKRFHNTLEFEPGLTAVVGANEAGKSLVLEFIRYAWFGKAALRGAASDYKTLKVELTAKVKDKQVYISRHPNKEYILVDGQQKAVGADAVNKFIVSFLGFPLKVFDIALTAMQDQLHSLTEMRPTERLAMIDQLTGTDALEQIEKECKDNAREARQVAEAFARNAAEPMKPEEPEGVSNFDNLVEELNRIRAVEAKREMLLAITQPVEPVAPEPVGFDRQELEESESQRVELERTLARLQTELSIIPACTVSKPTLDEYKAWLNYEQELQRRGPRPRYRQEQLDQWLIDWNDLQSDTVSCPDCGSMFLAGSGRKDIEQPPIGTAEIRKELERRVRWELPLEVVREYAGPRIVDVVREEQAHREQPRADAIHEQIRAIVVPANRASDLDRVRDYERDRAVYESRAERYEEEKASWEQAQELLASLPEQGDVQTLVDKIKQLEYYKQTQTVYEQQVLSYNRIIAEIEAQNQIAEGYDNGVKAIRATRLTVKQELVPSLSAAASFLLSSLTDGARSRVVVDEAFNVTVDGQPLHTLSGSGKGVVNLALRIGLAQVLTSQVLSLFMGDEIDGSMDPDRAVATHETFQKLTQHINQVILVTHKHIQADHIIEIG